MHIPSFVSQSTVRKCIITTLVRALSCLWRGQSFLCAWESAGKRVEKGQISKTTREINRYFNDVFTYGLGTAWWCYLKAK